MNIPLRILGTLLLAGTCLLPRLAAAAITCTISAPTTKAAYVDNAVAVSTQASFTVSCSRAKGDPQTVSYTVAAPGPGGNFSGTRRATLTIGGTPYYVGYTLGTATGCAATWTAASFTGTITWTNNPDVSARTVTHNYWVCVPQQTGMGASLVTPYADSFAITANNSTGGAQLATALAPVSFTVTPVCTIPVAPGTISFSYIASQSTQVQSSTAFSSRCTVQAGYTLSVSPATGTVLGLNYSLDVMSGVTVLSPSTTVTATGTNQNYSVRATVPAGQSGCVAAPCTAATQSHTLTLSY